MTLIQELELLLKERSMSPEDASRIIGCSVGQVYKWLRGKVEPGSLSVKAIRQALPKIRRIDEKFGIAPTEVPLAKRKP